VVNCLHRGADLVQNAKGEVKVEEGALLGNSPAERGSFHEFRHEVRRETVLTECINAKHVGVAKLRQRASLAQEALAEVRIT
jgi:hypothetical protein